VKQYLLFAGTNSNRIDGVNGLIGDFDSIAEAFVSLVDQQTPSEWWHVLDTKTGEVYDRRHLRVNNGALTFHRSDWIAGAPNKKAAPPVKVADLAGLEADLRSVVTSGVKNGNGHANGHGHGAEH